MKVLFLPNVTKSHILIAFYDTIKYGTVMLLGKRILISHEENSTLRIILYFTCTLYWYLLMRLLQMLHQDSDHHIDQDELRHQDEDDEEERREIGRNAAVAQTVIALFALLP